MEKAYVVDPPAHVAQVEHTSAQLPYGDRPICPCGKVTYPSKVEAKRAFPHLRAYTCPLGHLNVWHVTSRHPSQKR